MNDIKKNHKLLDSVKFLIDGRPVLRDKDFFTRLYGESETVVLALSTGVPYTTKHEVNYINKVTFCNAEFEGSQKSELGYYYKIH